MKNFLINLAFFILSRTPLNIRRFLAYFSVLFIPLNVRDSTIAKLQISLCFKNNLAKPSLAKVYRNLALNLLESFNLDPILNKADQLIEFSEIPEVRVLLKQNRPIIALTAHFGNWDLFAAYILKLGIPLTTIAKKNRNPGLQEKLIELRSKYGLKCIWRTDARFKKQIKNEIQDSLKPNEVLASLIDQDTEVSSIFSNFFDLPAMTPSGLIAIGKKVNAIFTFAVLVRLKNNRFKVIYERISDHLDIQGILDQYNLCLQETIKKYPEQWAWVHKRWRTLENGKRLNSEDYINYLKQKVYA